MNETFYRDRFRSVRRMLLVLVALVVALSVCLITTMVTREHITLVVAIAGITAAIVIVLLALALRIAFRNLPELERLSTKFDDDAAAERNGQGPGAA
jgi:uncharacterized BrkB/YihY/UPF0761 family membrane protein